MRSVNKVILIGNVVRDPESKTTTSGHMFCSFVLATNREWQSDGDSQSLAEFHKIVAWGKLAELCTKYLKKGKFIYIEGYLKTRTRDVEGKKVFRTEVVAQDMIMLNKRADSDGEDYEEYKIGDNEGEFEFEQEERSPKKKSEGGPMDLDGDDI